MISTSERYCLRDLECLEFARTADDPTVKERLLDLAKSWKELADIEKGREGQPVGRSEQRIAEPEREVADIDAAMATLSPDTNLDLFPVWLRRQ